MSNFSSSDEEPQPPIAPQQPLELDVIFSDIVAESPAEGSRVLAEGEASLFESAGQQFELAQQQVQIASARQDVNERKAYASKLYWLLVGWMSFVAVCFLLTGFTFAAFELSDSVLIALLTGATVNLVALFAIVAWYLFPKK